MTPTFTDVLRMFFAAERADIHTSLPARVERYDASTGLCDAAPLIRRGYIDAEGIRRTEVVPVATDVPVVAFGGGGFRLTFPIVIGDTVLLIFSEAAINRWRDGGGGAGGGVDPGDDRRHSLSDAFAIPGLSNAVDFDQASSTKLEIGKTGGPLITIDGSTIDAGGTSQLVTKAEFDAHMHPTAGTGAPSIPSNAPITGTTVLRGG